MADFSHGSFLGFVSLFGSDLCEDSLRIIRTKIPPFYLFYANDNLATNRDQLRLIVAFLEKPQRLVDDVFL